MPIVNSNHSSPSAIISMTQAVLNLFVSRRVFLKHQVNWNTVCGALQDLPGVTFRLRTILLRFGTSSCSLWLDIMYRPRSSVCSKDKPWFDKIFINSGVLLTSSKRFIVGGPLISLGLTEKSLTDVK